LAINVSAGEKSIPSEIKERFAPSPVNLEEQDKLFAEVDSLISQHYGFTDEETEFIINYDIKYRMGRGGDEGGE